MSQSVTERRAVDETGVKHMQITVTHLGKGEYVVSLRRVAVDGGIVTTALLKDSYQQRRVQAGTRFSKKNMNDLLQENLPMFDDAGFIEFTKGGSN